MPVASLGARRWCALVLAVSSPLAAQQATTTTTTTPQPAKLTLETYFDLEDVQDPQLSPDGKQVIYTRRWVDKLNDRWESSLWIMNADGTRGRHLRVVRRQLARAPLGSLAARSGGDFEPDRCARHRAVR